MYLKGPKSSYKAWFFRLGANRSNLISLPQQQLGAMEEVTKIKTDMQVGIGKSNTCMWELLYWRQVIPDWTKGLGWAQNINSSCRFRSILASCSRERRRRRRTTLSKVFTTIWFTLSTPESEKFFSTKLKKISKGITHAFYYKMDGICWSWTTILLFF